MEYSEKVLEHFRNPRNSGQPEKFNAMGMAGNAKCGDVMKIFLEIEDDKIADVGFKTFGCAAAVAASSMATELIKGRTIEDALALTNDDVANALDGLPWEKMHCSVLAEQAIKQSVADYYKRQGIDPTPIVGVLDDGFGHMDENY